MKSIWSEVRNYYYDDEESLTYIEGWLTDDENETGTVLAKVSDNKEVIYLDERAKTDEQAQEAIREVLFGLDEAEEFLKTLFDE